jgi:hypothetical protein
MAYQGYQQGGVMGGIETGLGVLGTIEAVAPHFGPWGIAIAAVAAGLSMMHPHYNPSTNPDMYADSGFAIGVANAQGSAYTQATGWVQEDASIKQQLGGLTQLQYLDNWYNAHPGGANLNAAALQMWNDIGALTGKGKGVGVNGLHQGNVFVSDASGSAIGKSGNWQDVLKTIDTDTQDLYTLLTSDQSLNTPMISVNAYGGSGMNPGFSPWYTPGLTTNDINAYLQSPYGAGVPGAPTNGAPSNGSPTGGQGGGAGRGNGGGNHTQNMEFVSHLHIDSETIASVVNSYRQQRESSGFMQNT